MKKKIKKKYIIFGTVLFLTIGLLTIGLTYGKYAADSVWNYYLGSKGFYFSSDYLGMESVENVNQLWDGKSTTFSLTNSENDLVATNFDISYTVTCKVINENSEDYSCTLNGTDSDTFSGTLSGYEMCINEKNDGIDVSSYTQSDCEINGYTWQKEIANQELYFDVVKKDGTEVTDTEVKITATSTSPYKKTLTGTFLLHKDPSLFGTIELSYQEENFVGNLIVTNTYEEEKCVTLTFDENKFRLDEDEVNIDSSTSNDQGYMNSITFKINGKQSQKIIFYKTDFQATYSVEDFTINESSTCQN